MNVPIPRVHPRRAIFRQSEDSVNYFRDILQISATRAATLTGVTDRLRTKPRQARSTETVDRILDAAELVLYRQGVDATTTQDIATSADISVGRLYYWFPDKNAVVRAVMERSDHLVRVFLEEAIVNTPERATPVMVKRMTEQLGAFVLAHPGTLTVLGANPVPGEAGNGLYQRFIDLASAIVDARVPDATERERQLVAVTSVRLVLTMLDEHVRRNPISKTGAPDTSALEEAAYALSAYLYSRYPSDDDQAWVHPDYPIRPARRPYPTGNVAEPIRPAYSDEVFANGATPT
jgi:AcrR family transcriptional regulator